MKLSVPEGGIMIIKKANKFLLLTFLLLGCSKNETGVIEKKIEIIKTDFFEVEYKKGEKCLFLTNKDEFDSFFESVVSVGDERFVNFADSVNGFDFNLHFYFVCPFKFATGEVNIQLVSLYSDANNCFVDFSIESPKYVDSDIRLYYFFNQINNKNLSALLDKECIYRIHNSTGKGCAYYE